MNSIRNSLYFYAIFCVSKGKFLISTKSRALHSRFTQMTEKLPIEAGVSTAR
jgi:hypothetical protein